MYNPIKKIRSVVRYFGAYEWTLVVLALFVTIAQVYFDLRVPEYMSSVTQTLVDGGTPDEIMADAVGMLACALCSLVTGIILTVIIGLVSSRYSKRLREVQFDRVQSFSMEEMGRFSTYSLSPAPPTTSSRSRTSSE